MAGQAWTIMKHQRHKSTSAALQQPGTAGAAWDLISEHDHAAGDWLTCLKTTGGAPASISLHHGFSSITQVLALLLG